MQNIMLTQLGVISVQGADAKTFMQGQVTCDMNEIGPTQSRLSAYCNLKGRVQSLFRIVYVQEQHYYLILPKSMIATTISNFKKYAIFSKVTLTDDSQQISTIGCLGNISTNLFTLDSELGIDECKIITIQEKIVIIAKIAGMAPRYEVYLPHELSITLEKAAAINWDYLDFLAKIPAVYPNTVDTFLPHHLNLTQFNAIGFKKGCYLGQEIIARMQYKGNIKKHLYQVIVTNFVNGDLTLQAGQHIIADNATEADAPGVIVRVATTLEGNYALLVVLDDAVVNTQLSLAQHPGAKLTLLN